MVLILSFRKASKALGNSKPDLLLKTEFHMWHALYSIAKGQASAHTAMQKFYSTVPWAEVELLSQSDRDFFKPGMFVVHFDVFQGGSALFRRYQCRYPDFAYEP